MIIVLAVVTLPLGQTTTKEYAELEWPMDVLIAIVWVIFAIVFFGTIANGAEPHLYVSPLVLSEPSSRLPCCTS